MPYQKNDELMCHYDDQERDSVSKAPSILALAVNLDATMIASGCALGTIRVWNVKSGKCLRSLVRVHGGAVTCLEFSRDGEDSTRILR